MPPKAAKNKLREGVATTSQPRRAVAAVAAGAKVFAQRRQGPDGGPGPGPWEGGSWNWPEGLLERPRRG
eukprot:5661233-Alexandrium_andersonii.AAC.1